MMTNIFDMLRLRHDCAKFDASWDHHYDGVNWHWTYVKFLAGYIWADSMCWWFGHTICVEGHSGENGSEDLACTRCGWRQKVYF